MIAKPGKPSRDFPLYPHNSGKWAKKVNGVLRYFGRWEDPDAALQEYNDFIGRVEPEIVNGALQVGDACNLFLHSKEQAVESGELSPRTYNDYKSSAIWFCKHFGRTRPVESFGPADFTKYKEVLASRRAVVALANEITRIRVMFKWFWDARLLPAPVHFGPDFKKPSAKALRRHRRGQGKKKFSPADILAVLDEAGVHYRAMIFLGINAGFGPTDLTMLTLEALERPGWIDFPRPKTEIDRRCPLWPETQEAINESRRRRAHPQADAEPYLFLRPSGRKRIAKEITYRFTALRQAAEIKNGSFYWLRHCTETIGGRAKDQIALNLIMGHVDATMAARYREEIDDSRLIAVTEEIRGWLFAKPSKTNGAAVG